MSNSYELKIGQNEDSNIFVKNVVTTSGLCYLIETNYSIQHFTESTWFYLSVKSKNDSIIHSLSEKSKLSNMQIFIALNNTWHGLYLYSWQFFDIPKVSIPIDTRIQSFVEIKPRMINFRDGVKNVKSCIDTLMGKVNCSQLCYPVAYNLLGDLPDCKTHQDMKCMMFHGYYDPTFETQFGQCLRPANALAFESKVIMTRPSMKNTNEIKVWFKYSTNQLEVKEEVLILGFTTFVGSIGGSLGLFLGFSCYDYLTNLINRFANILK